MVNHVFNSLNSVRVTDLTIFQYTRLEKVEEEFVVVDDELYRRVPDTAKFKLT